MYYREGGEGGGWGVYYREGGTGEGWGVVSVVLILKL